MNIQEFQKPIYEKSDDEFDSIYSLKIQKLSSRHWTPVEVAKRAADFLVTNPSTKVLDIGSGVGKFCLVAASYTQAQFTGVEQRASLIRIAQKTVNRCNIERVKFIHADIRSVNFREFNAFYFFNSFEENLDFSERIDQATRLDAELFEEYTLYVRNQLDEAPKGTRVATYCTSSYEIPSSYDRVDTLAKGKLNFWVKMD